MNDGLRLVIGSWKIIAMSPPSSARRSRARIACRSRPSKARRSARTRPGASIRPSTASAVTLLPEPDSPTMPTTSPASTEKLTSSTACSAAPGAPNSTVRRSTSSNAGDVAVLIVFSFGSSASRRPSPVRLKASTVIRIARPGSVTTHHALWMNSSALASIEPHSGVGGCAPRPRKPSAAASRIADEKPSVAWTISGAAQFGSTVSNISRAVPAPARRDACT